MSPRQPGHILFVATAGAGGDLQPLVAAALAVHNRGHGVYFIGDGSVRGLVQDAGMECEVISART